MGQKKKLLGSAMALAALAIVLSIGFAYSRFASEQIYQESVNHFQQLYTQVNAAFHSNITKTWRLLSGWEPYISNTADSDRDRFQAFIQAQKESWHFTGFYFLAADGSCIDELGQPGLLNLHESLNRLMDEQENIAADTILLDMQQITVFAVPVPPGRYLDFDYAAIAISFDTGDMTSVLRVHAYDDQSDCFVLCPDGRVLFSSQNSGEQPLNLLDYLRGSAVFDGIDADTVALEWEQGVSRVLTCRIDGTVFYLSYQPVGFDDWMLVSIAPADVVNSGMRHFAIVTLVVIILLFALIGVSVVVTILANSRRRIGQKDQEIGSREQLFYLLTQNTGDIFLLFSPTDFTAQYISPNLEEVLGLSPEEVCRDVRPLLFSDGDAIFPDEYRLTVQTLEEIPIGGTWVGQRDVLHAKTHELRWFKQTLYRCLLGEREQFILMLSDRTKERQMNEALGEALHTAKAANEAKSNFLANMSHDIRTPMNAIVGFSVLLSRDADDPEKVREYTRKIASSSQHLLSLINDILDMSKIESGKTSLNITEFSLPELIEELNTMILPQAQAKGQGFELYTRGDLPELLLGDKLRLNQVLINLLSNAVKYTQPGGRIALTVQRLEQNTPSHAHLRFTVADNGYGMSAGFIQIIFDPFAREITDATRNIQGTGLGMAITKNIVDLMGGTISVESEPGQGSTFTLEVELAIASLQRDDAFWRRHSITRLLVVDDEEDICLNVQSAMEDTGVTVAYATEGARAVEMASAAHEQGRAFHIILLDWKMPGMDGLETARQIRRQVGEDVPILVLTSFDLDDAREAAKDSHVDMFLPKPFFLSSFQRAMAQLLDGAAEEKPEPEAQSEISLKGLRVLAAEDNEINAEILAELLEIEEIQCEIVSNGQEALERFQRSQPGEFDMIFMDIQMPVMDGYEAARAIRACSHPMAKTIPMIAMTANAFEEDVQSALAAGMNAHTAKPIDMEKLKATAAQFWDHTQSK